MSDLTADKTRDIVREHYANVSKNSVGCAPGCCGPMPTGQSLSLGDFLVLGEGERRSGGLRRPSILSDTVVVLALVAVLVVLGLGLWNMLRGGSPSRSQNLMRWRVGLQFLAIIIVMAVIWIAG